ncbi:hypothetical protein MHC_03615 [Mycoplasma haemocanis str. Illinois]|uniref:Uncharacterized protein n=1 Tax=Mycoplasma haemocanis (strain Illinois) TaxID=1111676 RepID=H6N7G1_MYCHN|nr:hypothetical protein [Mycoplasma haemocanis]AEW45583.1 hypothetical protein MHC_03615 [Mycoplasma haemocanis str. Illinois]
MSLYKSLALVGGTATAVGGGVLISKSPLFQNSQSQQRETFKHRYSKATLGENDPLWETKFSNFSGNVQPTHEKLKEAKTKHTSNPNEAKSLHKRGCKEIYDSEWEGSRFLNDFKSYCSKTMGDAMKDIGTWIDQESSADGKWNTKLTSLSSHDEKQNGILEGALKNLKTSLTPSSGSNWDADKRTSLNNWCKEVKASIFAGEEDMPFKHAKLYCIDPKSASSTPSK